MRCAVLAALVFVCACRKPGLVSADGELRANKSAVDFGDRWLNTTATRSVLVTNTGRAPLSMSLEAPAPFAAPSMVTVAGGATTQIDLTFSPEVLGAAVGVLTVSASGAQLRLGLIGYGITAPACTSAICRDARLNESTLLCVLAPKADGITCTDGCVQGACVSGTCKGTPLSCDDADPCTTDGCSPGTGCVRTPVGCDAANPCFVGSCAPNAGCVETIVVDGSPCGAADCVTARVCVAGSCVSRAVPDGAACGLQSICQSAGRCASQQCVQAPPALLALAWSYAAPPGRSLHGLVADGSGNHFTAECADAGTMLEHCELVSFAPDGGERWRTAFSHSTSTAHAEPRDALMLAGMRVISTIGPRWVDAFEAASGVPAWSFDADDDSGPNIWGTWVSAAFDGTDELILLHEQHNEAVNPPRASRALLGLVAGTGEVRHVSLSIRGGSLVVGRTSGPLVAHASAGDLDSITGLDPSVEAPPALRCFSSDGGTHDCFGWGVRWQRTHPILGGQLQSLRAARKGQLLVADSLGARVEAEASGAPISAGLPVDGGAAAAVWGRSALYVMPKACPLGPCTLLEVVVADSQTHSNARVALPDVSWLSEPWLTQRDSALMSLKPTSGVAELREIGARGELLMQCPMGFDVQRIPASGLIRDRMRVTG